MTSQPKPDAQATPAAEAEVKAKAGKHDRAATADEQAAKPGTAAADQPFEARLEAALRSCISAFDPPTAETAPLRKILLRNTVMPTMAARTAARPPA